MSYRGVQWKDLCSSFVSSLLPKIFLQQKILKPLSDLVQVSFVIVLPQVIHRKIFYNLRDLPLGIVLIRGHHIPWFSFSLLFVVIAHWVIVNLSLAFGVLSQTSIFHVHMSTWTVQLRYSHYQCWASEWIFARLSLGFLRPNWDIFKLSFSEQPKPPKSHWMGPDFIES